MTGYSIKYAYRAALPDGGERIILATDRRLGAHTTAWQPLGAEALAKAAVMDYEFTVIEMRLDPKGLGEGKASLTTKVIVDNGDNSDNGQDSGSGQLRRNASDPPERQALAATDYEPTEAPHVCSKRTRVLCGRAAVGRQCRCGRPVRSQTPP